MTTRKPTPKLTPASAADITNALDQLYEALSTAQRAANFHLAWPVARPRIEVNIRTAVRLLTGQPQ